MSRGRPGGRVDARAPAYTFTSMRRVVILGSTGSIGVQALDVVARSDDLQVVGMAAAGRWERLLAQAEEFGVRRISLSDEAAAAQAASAWGRGEVLSGAEGVVRLVAESGADLVLNGLVGSAGLGPTVAALGEGIDVALANKESLVVGGELVMQLAEATGAHVIPVDSEHSALFQLLRKEPPGTVERLVVTASGGPFRGLTRDELADVSARRGARAPHLGHGRQDHDRLGHADEQGPRGDRGASSVRDSLRADRRGRPPRVDRARDRRPQRRRLARAPGPPGHAGPDLLRAALPRAGGRAGRATRPGAGGHVELRATRSRDIPVPCARTRRGGGRRDRARAS